MRREWLKKLFRLSPSAEIQYIVRWATQAADTNERRFHWKISDPPQYRLVKRTTTARDIANTQAEFSSPQRDEAKRDWGELLSPIDPERWTRQYRLQGDSFAFILCFVFALRNHTVVGITRLNPKKRRLMAFMMAFPLSLSPRSCRMNHPRLAASIDWGWPSLWRRGLSHEIDLEYQRSFFISRKQGKKEKIFTCWPSNRFFFLLASATSRPLPSRAYNTQQPTNQPSVSVAWPRAWGRVEKSLYLYCGLSPAFNLFQWAKFAAARLRKVGWLEKRRDGCTKLQWNFFSRQFFEVGYMRREHPIA